MKKLPKRRIRENRWGNINGYEGNRKVEDFGLDDWSAVEWCLRRKIVTLVEYRAARKEVTL